MNADEYDTRELLIQANIVAFADANYHYRKHPNSITTKFSIVSFDTLITDKMLEVLIKKHFGINSPQTKQVQKQRMEGIISKQLLLIRSDKLLSKSNRKKANKMIKENYIDLDKRYLYENNTIKHIFLTKSYSLFIVAVYIHNLLIAKRDK
jgi:hypothetical protein